MAPIALASSPRLGYHPSSQTQRSWARTRVWKPVNYGVEMMLIGASEPSCEPVPLCRGLGLLLLCFERLWRKLASMTVTTKHTGSAVRRRAGRGGCEATGSATRGTAQDPRSDQTSRCADEDEGILFGGPVGTGCIVVASHIMVLYLYYVNRVAGGALVNPWTGSHGGVSGCVSTSPHGHTHHHQLDSHAT